MTHPNDNDTNVDASNVDARTEPQGDASNVDATKGDAGSKPKHPFAGRGGGGGSPNKAARRAREHELFAKQEWWDEFFEFVATGGIAIEYARLYDVRWNALVAFMHKDAALSETYEAARRARVLLHLDRLENIAAAVEAGTMDSKRGAVASNVLQWLTERIDRRYSPHATQDLKVADTTEQHLVALRAVMERRTQRLAASAAAPALAGPSVLDGVAERVPTTNE